jgi:hypothetical protein
MENTFDYATQMAFYYVLILVNDEIECDVYLDVMSKTAPFASIPYRMSKEKLKRKMQDEIKPALNALQEAFKNNERKS